MFKIVEKNKLKKLKKLFNLEIINNILLFKSIYESNIQICT